MFCLKALREKSAFLHVCTVNTDYTALLQVQGHFTYLLYVHNVLTTEWYYNKIKNYNQIKKIFVTQTLCVPVKNSVSSYWCHEQHWAERNSKETNLSSDQSKTQVSFPKTAPAPNDQMYIFGLDPCDSELHQSREPPVQSYHLSHWWVLSLLRPHETRGSCGCPIDKGRGASHTSEKEKWIHVHFSTVLYKK